METVLVLESDSANLVAQSLILRCFGYGVLEASSRAEAWRACDEHQGSIHLVLMKAIPDIDSSREFVARLRLMCPQIVGLFVSDTSSTELADKQHMPSEYAFLQKPFPADALAGAIRGLLDGRASL